MLFTFLTNNGDWRVNISICPYDQLILKESCVIDLTMAAMYILISRHMKRCENLMGDVMIYTRRVLALRQSGKVCSILIVTFFLMKLRYQNIENFKLFKDWW
jgi:hypothetical protein